MLADAISTVRPETAIAIKRAVAGANVSLHIADKANDHKPWSILYLLLH